MNDIMEVIYGTGIVPVVVLNNENNASTLATVFLENNIPIMEVTFRTPAACNAVRNISENNSKMIVGAGTILSVEMAEAAINAGAKFIICPGYDDSIVNYCTENNIPIIPGVSTATEVQKAVAAGLDILKFFPAEQSGGVGMLKSLSSPFSGVRFMPTGGINAENIGKYCRCPNVLACGGSWVCPSTLIDEGKFGEISSLCKEAIQKIHGFSLCHVGINANDHATAANVAQQYQSLLSLPIKEYTNSLFVGDIFEIMKIPFLGEKGHIAIGVNNIKRAMKFFEIQGYSFSETGYVEGNCAYFNEQFGEFAVHLKQL